ncbi:pirin [Flavobacterium limnosediminis JC2902]|uniref:Pirin n=2 Tax=Flavobacterium TaxID=237 RepID=V6SRX3_9FLAO|nr:pirin [Flavobacterium limnosediminis JC2902]
MNRKDFIRKTILGGGAVITGTALANSTSEKTEEVVGFNHIQNTNSKIMENSILHKADTRGKANHGWLQSFHTFSFANYHNPERMNFGVLRVLNDDTVSAGMGFGKHPHQDMEIISIPLEGDLEHQDSMGNKTVIRNGDIQVMSAGTGVQHSEYNKNEDEQVKFLQIWVIPNKRGVTPRYDQITLNKDDRKNKLQQILSPNPEDAGVWIHQDAWFHLGKFDQDVSTEYNFKKTGNGLYVFVLSGDLTVNNQELNTRDGFGIWDTDTVTIKANSETEFLLMEVPMQIQ